MNFHEARLRTAQNQSQIRFCSGYCGILQIRSISTKLLEENPVPQAFDTIFTAMRQWVKVLLFFALISWSFEATFHHSEDSNGITAQESLNSPSLQSLLDNHNGTVRVYLSLFHHIPNSLSMSTLHPIAAGTRFEPLSKYC